MKNILLGTKRPWSWKVFFLLVGSIIPATFAILPYALHQQNVSFGWDVLLIERLIYILLYSLLGGIGLMLANRIGLGLPFVESWIRKEPIPYRFRNIAAIAWMAAVAVVLLSILIHMFVDPAMNAMLQKLDIPTSGAAPTPPLYGFLAALSAGINEETLFRLFGLSLLAWLGGLFFHEADGRPKLFVFWLANVLFALAFGAAHLQTEAAMGIPMTALVITSTLVLNGIGGLVFGWLFWTFGLECAILTHIFADIIRHSLIPFITIQQEATAKYFAVAAVVLIILVTFAWAYRCLITDSRRYDLQPIR